MSTTKHPPESPLLEPPRPRKRARILLAVVSSLVLLGFGIAFWAEQPDGTYNGQLHTIMGAADRIVVRDGGFNCCGPVDDEAILFQVTNPSEIRTVREHLKFLGTTSPCNCCGFPGIDWHKRKERIALTAVQHGKALRWGRDDLRLSAESCKWLTHWLVSHGVKEQEIEGGCGGPRRDLRHHAARMRLAQNCVTRGETRVAQGDLDAAIADFTEAINHDVNFARAYYLRGLALEKKGTLDRAIEDFTEAIWFSNPFIADSRAEAAKFISGSCVPVELDGNLAPVYYARGRAYEKKGDKAKAEEDFTQARKREGKPE